MSEQNQATPLAGGEPMNVFPKQPREDALAELAKLKQQVEEAHARAIEARDAIPGIPDGVGAGGSDTTILILLELRAMSSDPVKAAIAEMGIQRMAARTSALAAFAAGPEVEYGKLERELILKARKLGVSPY